LLDIHPEPEHGRILVRVGQGTREAGIMDDTAYIRDIRAGRAVIASLIREGLFTREREAVFRQVLHASDVDSWLTYREQGSSRSIVDAATVGTVRELMAQGGEEILLVDNGYASRLRRLGERSRLDPLR
jgi:hypothetical protein